MVEIKGCTFADSFQAMHINAFNKNNGETSVGQQGKRRPNRRWDETLLNGPNKANLPLRLMHQNVTI